MMNIAISKQLFEKNTSIAHNNPMDLSDKKEVRKLVKACIQGNRTYQKLLYEMMYNKMMSICYRYCQRKEEAEDLFQEGFIKVFTKMSDYNFKGSFEGWIRRIMVNHAIDSYRKNKKKFSFSESLIEANNIPDNTVDENIYNDLNSTQILELVQKLSPSYRIVFNMYVLDGYSHKDIADELNISEGTSKSNLSKAKVNLRMMVREHLNKVK